MVQLHPEDQKKYVGKYVAINNYNEKKVIGVGDSYLEAQVEGRKTQQFPIVFLVVDIVEKKEFFDPQRFKGKA